MTVKMQTHLYILVNGEPVAESDVLKWARWLGAVEFEAEVRVGLARIGDITVSTVFCGIDQNLGAAPPLLWETMVFGESYDETCERYSSLEAAKAGHEATVQRVSAPSN